VTWRVEHNKMAEELFKECLDDVLKELSSKGFAFTLKAEQQLALRHLFDGKDVLAVLPTGFGKSLTEAFGFRTRQSVAAARATPLVAVPVFFISS